MVAAIPSPASATPIAAAASTVRAHKAPSSHHRRRLAPSEKDNAALSQKPPAKEISSRFLPSSSSSTSTLTSRHVPSPLPTSSSSGPQHSHSVDQGCPSAAAQGGGDGPSAAARALCTTTRSLSVSFQGESFFQTSKAKPVVSPSPARKPSPDRRRLAGTPSRSDRLSENLKSFNHHQR